MPSRILGSLALLVAAISAERFAYYGYHSFLTMILMSAFQLTAVQMGAIYGEITVVSFFASLCAGGLAFVLPPRIIALIGAMTAALGLVVLASAGAPSGAIAGLFVATLGTGLMRPCAYAYAARVLTYEGETELVAPSGRRFLSMASFVALALGMVNVGAFLAPLIFGALYDRVGYRAPAVACAGINVLVAALYAVSLLVDRETRAPSNTPAAHTAYRTEPGTHGAGASPATNPLAIVTTLGIAVTGALAYFVTTTANRIHLVDDYRQVGVLQATESVMTALTAFVLFIVLLVLAQKRSSVSLALFVGGGYVAFAFSAFLLCSAAFSLRLLAMSAMGFAQPFLGLGLVFAALAVRRRGTALLIAGFLLIEMLGSVVGGPVSAIDGLATIATMGGAALLIGAGIALVVLAPRIRALFEQTHVTP